APALDRVLPGEVVVARAGRDALARELLDALDDAPLLGVERRHGQRMPLTSARADALQRQVPASWSSIMLPAGSCMKTCCDRGPTTPSATQYSTPSRSSSLRASWMSGTASATWGDEGSFPGPFANFDWPFTPIRWICARPPTSIQ